MSHTQARRRCAGLVLALGYLGVSACDEGARSGYLVTVNIKGKPEAFENVQIELNGKIAPPPTIAAGGNLQVETHLCTANRAAFLNAPLTIRVTRSGGSSVETVVERLGCRTSENPGDLEFIFVRLRDDGHIEAAFGSGDPMILTFCGSGFLAPCPRDEF